jgi:hypothetical protein
LSCEESFLRKLRSRVGRGVTAAASLLLMPSFLTAPANAVELGEEGKVKLSADFRFRLEADWDSQRADGRPRDDRNRARVRARVGLDWKPSKSVSFGVRLRSGSDLSHQSPHITIVDFDDNDTGDVDFNLDKWFLKVSRGKGWAWAGRNSVPFWRPDEIVADDDVTPAGLAAGYGWDWEESKISLSGGYFSLPVGMRQFAGNLAAGQLVYETKAGGTGLTFAGGFLGFDADPNDPDAALLLNGNGFRDYDVWVGNAQIRRKFGDLPLTFGVDYMHNAEDYSPNDPDPFTAANFDQTDGWLVSAQAGSLKQKGDWLAAYYYAEIETFAVNSSYAQDDWVRWGSATETRATNMKGHELRGAYAFSGSANLVARLYLVDAITTIEDGNRFRIDFNFKF